MEMVERCINEVLDDHDEWDVNDNEWEGDDPSDEWEGEDEFELEPEPSFQDLSTVKKCTMQQYQTWVKNRQVFEFSDFPKQLKLTPYRVEENGDAIVYDAKTETGMHWCYLGISGKDNVKWAEICRKYPGM